MTMKLAVAPELASEGMKDIFLRKSARRLLNLTGAEETVASINVSWRGANRAH
jgi:hypothetical protein